MRFFLFPARLNEIFEKRRLKEFERSEAHLSKKRKRVKRTECKDEIFFDPPSA